MTHPRPVRAAGECIDLPFELKRIERVARAEGDDIGVFEGLAATFGDADLVGDVIAPGAFGASIAQPRTVKMLWQHDAAEPIGVWEELEETAKGLRVKGRLLMGVRRAEEAYALLRAGAVDALSIGFNVPEGGAVIDRATGDRRLGQVDLWEISIVTFPINPGARVELVKAAEAAPPPRDITTTREFERFLREAGLPRAFAKAVTLHGFAGARTAIASRREAEGEGLEELAAAIKRATDRLSRLTRGYERP